ncbi:MAG: LemA family protein [Verrucomicrobiota bacterium]|jgi:LemA protein|nr:LemA family protein [Verrucomicrobiota bacterium]MEE2715134.1 LemA family protein [Verrucomicrobiota bacterium]MEE2813408.1 LemA family protein [Verrucomicrobiota bacterium]
MNMALIIVGVAVFILVLMVAGMYNGLVKLRNLFKNAFAQIDVQLKRRYDLIPNLVETAKGYMKHERETLESVTKARNTALSAAEAVSANPSNASAMSDLVGAEALLGGAMSKLMVSVEAYPDLKANSNMISLQEELAATEDKIAIARQAFNQAVTDYNIKRETFPTMIIAGIFGFIPAELFEITAPDEREAVKVSFS